MVYKIIVITILLACQANLVKAQGGILSAIIVNAISSSDEVGVSRQAAKHMEKAKNTSILIRLADEKQRIAYMKDKGKALQAQEFGNKTKQLNDDMIAFFTEHFDYCQVYFYYSSDADAVLKEKNFDLLWVDGNHQAQGVTFEEAPYILMYGPVSYLRWNTSDKLTLHHWDFNKMDYIESTAFPSSRMGKWKRRLQKRNKSFDFSPYSDLELQVAGLNATFHAVEKMVEKRRDSK